nr:transposase, MuDR [Ipomoea batatas]
MGSRSTQAEDGSLSKDSGGAHNYTFSLKLSYGGRIHQSIPPKYLEGKVRTFSNLDSDEWGIMTLMDKVIEVGYKKDDHLRFFSRTDNGLIELVNDLETWNLVNNVVKPKVVEIWVITGVDGLEETCDADEVGVIGEEETFNEDEVEVSSEDSDWEERDSANELELFEGSENEIDDQYFVKYVDPNVEYGGVEVEGPRLEVQVPRAVQTVNAENVAVTEDELSHYNSDDGVETHVGKGHNAMRCPQKPHPVRVAAEREEQVGQREVEAEETPIHTQPELEDNASLVPIEVQEDDGMSKGYECPIEVDPLINVGDIFHSLLDDLDFTIPGGVCAGYDTLPNEREQGEVMVAASELCAGSTTLPVERVVTEREQHQVRVVAEMEQHQVRVAAEKEQDQARVAAAVKGKQPLTKSKAERSLGLTKSSRQVERKYMTRSSMGMKFSNDSTTPIELD